jgi:small ligand-binding sensory domain FIST
MPAGDRRLSFSTALSHEPEASAAGRSIADSVRAGLASRPADLAFLFFSSHYADQAHTLATVVRANLAPRVLIGCTGEGVIGGDQELEAQAAVVLWAACLPEVTVTPIRPTFVHEHAQGEIRSSVTGWPNDLESRGRVPIFLLLGDPFSTPMDELLGMLADRYPTARAIGGLAGGGSDIGENRLILDDEVFEEGAVAVALSGPIDIRTVISQGCRPIGEPYVVTKAERNVIYELGGAPALQRLQAAFESLSPEEREIASRALHVGIVTDEHRAHFDRGDFLVRNLIGADRGAGSLAIGDVVREGQTVQFHVRDARSASEDINLLLAADRSAHAKPPLGALLFSCCGRGRGLFGQPHHDIAAVLEQSGKIPVAGFFAQGEIGPVGGANFLHGYTASVAVFSEPDFDREPSGSARRSKEK